MAKSIAKKERENIAGTQVSEKEEGRRKLAESKRKVSGKIKYDFRLKENLRIRKGILEIIKFQFLTNNVFLEQVNKEQTEG